MLGWPEIYIVEWTQYSMSGDVWCLIVGINIELCKQKQQCRDSNSLHNVSLLELLIILQLFSSKLPHTVHLLAASPSTVRVGIMTNLSMWCCCWGPTGGGEWRAWHLLSVLSSDNAKLASSLSWSVLVMWTSCSQGQGSGSAVSKEEKYTWAVKLHAD